MRDIQTTDQTQRKRGRPPKSPTVSASLPELLPKPITITFKTAKEISGLGLTSLWALAKAGKLDVVRVRRRTLIRYASLERLLET